MTLLQSYLQPHEANYVDLCRRVANALADSPYEEAEFFEALIHKEFIPASMILKTAGLPDPCYASDIALPWEEKHVVAEALKHGLGVSLHLPRTESPSVVVEFLLSFKECMQRGWRPGAVMLTCDADHPFIEEFIQLKHTHRTLTHVNFSVKISQKKELLQLAPAAHACGDPGWVRRDAFPDFVSPCGQQSLQAWGGYVYAHINLAEHIQTMEFLVPDFLTTVAVVKKFLDRAVKKHSSFSKQSLQGYRIGFVGYYEACEKLRINYGDEDAKKFLELLGSLIGSHVAIAPTGATSQLVGLTPNIEPKDSLGNRIQYFESIAVLQKRISGAISSTFLFDQTTSVQEVLVFLEKAWDVGLRGCTIYRVDSLEKKGGN